MSQIKPIKKKMSFLFLCLIIAASSLAEATPLRRVADVLQNPNDPDYQWVKSVYSRVARKDNSTGGSSVLWYHKKSHGILLESRHAYQPYSYYFKDRTRKLDMPDVKSNGSNYLAPNNLFPQPDGESIVGFYSETFYQKKLPPESEGMSSANDFVVGGFHDSTVDDPKNKTDWMSQKEILNDDTADLQLKAGDPVLLLGYPLNKGELYYSIGQIADQKNKILGKMERDGFNHKQAIAYTNESANGMSGGGVFDKNGQLVAVHISCHYKTIRKGVRVSYIKSQLQSAVTRTSEQTRRALSGWLPMFEKKSSIHLKCSDLYP